MGFLFYEVFRHVNLITHTNSMRNKNSHIKIYMWHIVNIIESSIYWIATIQDLEREFLLLRDECLPGLIIIKDAYLRDLPWLFVNIFHDCFFNILKCRSNTLKILYG